MKKYFANGFQSWQETHYQVCTFIGAYLEKWGGASDNSAIIKRYEDTGTGGMYELAEEWTDEFELTYKLESWEELDFFDVMEEFLNNKNKQ